MPRFTKNTWSSCQDHGKCIVVFSVASFKVDENRVIDKVQNLRKEKKRKYAKTLAKIQVTAIFLKRDMRGNVLPKFIDIVWRRHAGIHLNGHQHRGRKSTKTSVTEFCCKSVNLFLEELKNNKIIFFLIHELFR